MMLVTTCTYSQRFQFFLVYTYFFYQQPISKQLAFGWQIATQLLSRVQPSFIKQQ